MTYNAKKLLFLKIIALSQKPKTYGLFTKEDFILKYVMNIFSARKGAVLCVNHTHSKTIKNRKENHQNVVQFFL